MAESATNQATQTPAAVEKSAADIKCKDCGLALIDPSQVSFFRRTFLLSKYVTEKRCEKCEKSLCFNCSAKHPLLIPNFRAMQEQHEILKEKIDYSALSKDERKKTNKEIFTNKNIHEFCKDCFAELSSVDFTRTYDVLGPEDGAPIIFAHGGGSSRMMFTYHANLMIKEKGYRCYLFDFPGHSSRVNEECTIDACVNAAVDIAKIAIENDPLHRKPLYIGLSFGGYVGFKVLATHPDLFCAAVIGDCGQNIGPGRGIAASLGMKVMRMMVPKVTNRTIMQQFLTLVSTQNDLDTNMVLETTFQAGFYFERGVGIIDTLSIVDAAECIPRFQGPILYANGSKDHHDSQDKWLSLCTNKERSKLKVYKGGDHFFCHDSRFFDSFVHEMINFYENELQLNKPTQSSEEKTASLVTA